VTKKAKGEPEPARLKDECAACGRSLLVPVRSWEWMRSFWGRVITAPLCKRSVCKVKAEQFPSQIERTIRARQDGDEPGRP